MLTKQTKKYAAPSKSVNAFLIGAVTAMGLSTNAFADDLSKAKRIEVVVKTADLQSDTGIERVYSELKRAAKTACDPHSFLYRKSTIKACETDLMTQFITDLGHADISKLHAVKTRQA